MDFSEEAAETDAGVPEEAVEKPATVITPIAIAPKMKEKRVATQRRVLSYTAARKNPRAKLADIDEEDAAEGVQ